jgi:hypothetical protein
MQYIYTNGINSKKLSITLHAVSKDYTCTVNIRWPQHMATW